MASASVRREAVKGGFNGYIIKLDRRWVWHSKTHRTMPHWFGSDVFLFLLVIIGETVHGDIIIYIPCPMTSHLSSRLNCAADWSLTLNMCCATQ